MLNIFNLRSHSVSRLEYHTSTMSKKLPDPETQLEVDEAILEYLVYVATAALLRDAQARGKDGPLISPRVQADLIIQMVDCMVMISYCYTPDTLLTSILH